MAFDVVENAPARPDLNLVWNSGTLQWVRAEQVVGGTGGTTMVDDAAFTPGSTGITPAGGTYRSIRDLVDDNDGGAFAMTQKRAILASLEDSTGDSAMDDVNNAVRVNIVAGAGSGGSSQTDKTAFTEGTTAFTTAGGVVNDTPVSDPIEDQAAAVRITPKRAFHANLRNVGGAEVGVAAAPIRTDPTGTTAQPVTDNASSLTVDAPVGTPVSTRLSDGVAYLTTVGGRLSVDASGVAVPVTDNAASLTVDNAGTFATQDSQALADNGGFTDGTSKVFPTGYLFDEIAGVALTENDVAAARIDSKRAQVSVLEDATTRGQRATVTAGNALKVDGSAVTQPVSGTVTANAGTGPFPVSDNGGSLTVDAPVGTPVAVRLSDGVAFVDGRDIGVYIGKTLKTAAISVAVSGDNTIVTAVPTKRIKVYAIKFGSTGTVSAKWKDGAVTDLEGAMDFQAREGYTEAVTPPAFLLATSAGNALILNLSAAVAVRGRVTYWDDDGT